MRFLGIWAAAFAAFVFISPLQASGDNGDALLQHVSSTVADDGSTRITLSFNRAAPETRVIRSGEHTVHIVLIGAALPGNEHPVVSGHGEITQGTFAGFAGIGMRLDLRTRDRITVRTETAGNEVIVHVPARRSDHEAPPPPLPVAAAPLPTANPAAFVTEMVRLSYADVSEIAGALVKGAAVPSNDVFNVGSPFVPPPAAAGSTTATAMPTYVSIPTATLLPKDSPQGVRLDEHVAIDRRLNAVILSGTREQVDAYKALVAQLDIPDRSVLLETQIVELTVSGAKDLGIDFSPNGTLTTATMGVSTGNKPVFGFNLGAAVNALAENGEAKILARPRILSLNNRPSAILSGEAVPIFTSVVIPGGTGTIVNQSVQYINVGVSLQILPRIAADGRVTTQIFCEVSSIIDYVQNTPRIAVRQELTSAVVSDSESLIVGGLLQETEIKSLRKVPGLGNLPLVGGFFRDVDNSSQNTNLYIVITPHVLTNGLSSNGRSFDLPPQPIPTIPPADPNIVPGPVETPPPAAAH